MRGDGSELRRRGSCFAVLESGGIEGGAGGGWRSLALLRSDEAGRRTRTQARQGSGVGDGEVSHAGEGAMGGGWRCLRVGEGRSGAAAT